MKLNAYELARERAAKISGQIGERQQLDIELDGITDDLVAEILEKRGCVVERYVDAPRATVYLLTNKRPEAVRAAVHLF